MSWRFAATSRAPGRPQPAAHPPVAGDEVDPVAGPGGQRRQQQGGVHRRVESGYVVDPAGRRTRGVEHQHHPAVALGLPGADHDDAVARARPPVDRADVVAADVLAQRVELRPLPAHPHRGPAVELAQPGQPAGQVLAGLERRQRPHHALDRSGSAAGRRARAGPRSRTVTPTARRSPRRRGSSGVRSTARSPGPSASGCRLPEAPAVGCQASRSTPRTRRRDAFVREQPGLGRVRRAGPCRPAGARGRAPPAAARAAGRRATSRPTASTHSHTVPMDGRSTTGTTPEQEQQRDPAGDRHQVPISAAPAPSRARTRAPGRRRRPRARPRGAARAGAPASRGRAP